MSISSISAIYGLDSTDIHIPTAFEAVVSARTPGKSITVMSVVFWPNAWAQTTLTFSDSLTGVNIGILNVPAQPPQIGDGSNGIFVNFGAVGTQLSPGANLNLSVSINGASGRLHIESYQKGPIYVVVPYQAPMTAGSTNSLVSPG